MLLTLSGPAAAGQASYAMSMTDCLKALGDTAQQLSLPLAYSVDTPARREFSIATRQGPVVMRCEPSPGGAYDALLTVITPGATSIAPYVADGTGRAQ